MRLANQKEMKSQCENIAGYGEIMAMKISYMAKMWRNKIINHRPKKMAICQLWRNENHGVSANDISQLMAALNGQLINEN